MLSVQPKLDYLVNSRFKDYSSSSTSSSPLQSGDAKMGELKVERDRSSDRQRHAESSSPVSRIRMDSPSSESMDSAVESCHVNTRKRRRGVIEKRRRDRINNSLAELRRLVPSAFEKQGSAKLEKAEILQMTVDHLKTIHTKGLNYDPHGIDPFTMGFQECVAEVIRFCQSSEGLQSQDPVRTRLVSHLQCYSAQRETFKQTGNAWHSQYPTGPTGLPVPPPPPGMTGSSPLFQSQSEPMTSPTCSMGGLATPSCLGTSGMAYTSPSSSNFNSPSFAQNAPYPAFANANTMQYMNSSNVYQTSRPYRPWGSEMAY